MAESQETPPSVVIAMDESDSAKYAFKWYAEHVYKPGDHAILVNVVNLRDALNHPEWLNAKAGRDTEVMRELINIEKAKIRKRLEHFAELLKEAQIEGTVKSIHDDHSGKAIIEAAVECKARAIVTGSRGMGKLSRAIIGSTSDFILHHSHIPVVICRLPKS